MARAAVPSSSTNNRRLRLRYVVVLVVLVWAGWRFLTIEMPQLSTLRHQQQSLQSQLTSLKAQQNKLKVKVSEFNNKQFLEQYASRHFGLVAPGQQLFIVAPKH